MIVPRTRVGFALRSSLDLDSFRAAVAAALSIPVSEVRELREAVDPIVRYEWRTWPSGFCLAVDLFIDHARVVIPPVPQLVAGIARGAGIDAAHHDGSVNPYGYVLARADGTRVLLEEIDDPEAGLLLDEDPDRMRILPPLA